MTMPETTQIDLVDRLRELDAAATPGPWEFDGSGITDFGREYPCSLSMEWQSNPINDDGEVPKVKQDGALIVYLRNAVPDILGMAAEITRLRADSERLRKIESQMDGGRFDEWPTATFVGQLRMQSRDNLDPEYSQFMAATANHMESLRAHCEAMEKALGLYTCHPCPVCNGDCGSANPPVLNCPTQAALNAFGGWDAYRKESGA